MDRVSEPYLACFGVEVCVEIIFRHWPNAHSHSQIGLEDNFFASTLVSASSIWRRPGLGLVNLALKKCAIQCKTILVVSISWLYHCKWNRLCSQTVGIQKKVVRHCNL